MSQTNDGMLRLRLLDDGETVEATGLNYGLRLSALDLTEDQERKLRAGRILKLKSVSTRAGDRRTPDGIPVPPSLEAQCDDVSPEQVEKLKALLPPVNPLNVKAVVVSGNGEPLVLNVNSIRRVEPNGDETECDNDSARKSLGQLGVGAGLSGGGSSGQGSGTSPGVGPDMRFVEGVRREITEKVRAVDKDAVVSFGRGSFDGGVFFSDKTRQNEILTALNSGGFVQVDPPRIFDDGVSICFKPFVLASPGSVRPTLHNPETLIPFPKDEFESAMLKYCVANYFLKDENDLVWSGIPERFFVDRIFEYSGRFEDALAAYERNPSSCVTLMVFNISRFPLLYWFVKGVWEAVPFSPKPRPFLPDDESEVTVIRTLRSALEKSGLEGGSAGESASVARNSGPKSLRWQEHLAQKKERLRKHAERLLLDDDHESRSFHIGTHFLTIWDGVSERRKPDGFESFGFFDDLDDALRIVDEHPGSCLSLCIADSISGRVFIWHRKGDRWELQDFEVNE